MEQIDSGKINPSLVMMRECTLQSIRVKVRSLHPTDTQLPLCNLPHCFARLMKSKCIAELAMHVGWLEKSSLGCFWALNKKCIQEKLDLRRDVTEWVEIYILRHD